MKTIFITMLSLLFGYGLLNAQPLKIEGKVLDINTHHAIAHVNIFIKGTQQGTISDFAGRFSLTVSRVDSTMTLIFRHINYHQKSVALKSIRSPQNFYLQPRVIPLPEVAVEARAEKLEIEKDLPQAIHLIKSENFDIRGYVDAGDLLRTEQSVQVQEELSGKKTVSIRGGNPDDVAVLYNGIKINSEYDYSFNFSMVDLEDVDRFEVIKGGNTALYGAEAFSGVINIVPKVQKDYHIRFNQRIGSYDSGNWGLHLYHNYKNLHASYQVRQGAARRMFADAIDASDYLKNSSTHHTANLVYNFSEPYAAVAANTLRAMFIRSDLAYHNYRDNESFANRNQLAALQYSGDIYLLKNLNLSLSRQWLDEKLFLSSSVDGIDREVDTRSLNLHAEKTFSLKGIEFLGAYQFENSELDLIDTRFNMPNQPPVISRAGIQRTRQGLTSVIKLDAPSGSEAVKTVNFDLSYRYDVAHDEMEDLYLINFDPYDVVGKDWRASMLKFAALFSGYRTNYAFDVFMNFGSNVKFPSLSQLVSYFFYRQIRLDLEPEQNRGIEIGLTLKRDLSRNPVIYGWQFTANYLNNHYTNKLRPNYLVGIPFAYYDNVPDARISGFELNSQIYFLKKKVTAMLGLSRYSITEKSAFPFKSEFKQTATLKIDHAGYAFQVYWFHEGEQVAWIHQPGTMSLEVILPGYANVDLHLSKTVSVGKLKLFGNISLRNLLNDEFELQGLALRDRRYYLTAGVQY